MLIVLVAFAAGVVTSLSPCVLPVLPIVLAAGQGRRARPYFVVLGLVVSFTFSVLAASAVLKALHLPQDLLVYLAIVLLALGALALLWPWAAAWLERPLLFLTRRPAVGGPGLVGGLVLGLSAGLVFVPCAGPVLAAVSSAVATHRVGPATVVALGAYALGAGLPLLAVAVGGRALASRLRGSSRWLRPLAGLLLLVGAGAFFVDAVGLYSLNSRLAAALPGYTDYFQRHVEARHDLSAVSGRLRPASPTAIAAGAERGLPDYGPAPEFAGITAWLDTPGGQPLTMRSLRGKVVLVDFWTYSCVNCLRTLPHLDAWDQAYRRQGLVIVGVHTPEFAFEHVLGNVRLNARRLGVRYPVALDDDYRTWDAYRNQYWPAEYLVDRRGQVVHTHFGEGDYDQTEALIRRLLGAQGTQARPVADRTPTELTLTPESYLGLDRLDPTRYAGAPPQAGTHAYTLPTVPLAPDYLAFGGQWTLSGQTALAGADARLELAFTAKDVYLVLGGQGTVTVAVDGRSVQTLAVNGDRLYTLYRSRRPRSALLSLRLSPGVTAYAFTFG